MSGGGGGPRSAGGGSFPSLTDAEIQAWITQDVALPGSKAEFSQRLAREVLYLRAKIRDFPMTDPRNED